MIDWAHFTPWTSLAGGILIGAAAAMFLLLHASALVGMRPMLNPGALMRAGFVASATALCFGTILFSADLVLRSLAGMAAFAFAAPAGGMLMIAGWALLAVAAFLAAASRPMP